MNQLFTPWRLKWYPFAVFVGLAISFVVCIFSGTGATILSGRLGGDFPAFYSAGRIVLSGETDQLYSIDRQIHEQHLIDSDEKGVLPFPYPPFVALAYAPVSFFSYRMAYTIHTMINVIALIIAVSALRSVNPEIKLYFLPVFTLCLLFYPVLKAVLNGQNTALSLMFIALVWKYSSEDKPIVAGIFLGLLFYKPQFAVPLLGLYLLSGRFKTVLSSIIILGILIAVNHLFYGTQWLTDWINFIWWFSPADAINNKHNAICWAGFLTALFGAENMIASYAGWLFIILTVVFVSIVWFLGKNRSNFNAQMGLAAICLILIPPHVMFYDFGLIIFSYAAILENISKGKLQLIFIVWIFSFAQVFAKDLGFSPLFVLVMFTFVLSIRNLVFPAIKPIYLCHEITHRVSQSHPKFIRNENQRFRLT